MVNMDGFNGNGNNNFVGQWKAGNPSCYLYDAEPTPGSLRKPMMKLSWNCISFFMKVMEFEQEGLGCLIIPYRTFSSPSTVLEVTASRLLLWHLREAQVLYLDQRWSHRWMASSLSLISRSVRGWRGNNLFVWGIFKTIMKICSIGVMDSLNSRERPSNAISTVDYLAILLIGGRLHSPVARSAIVRVY